MALLGVRPSLWIALAATILGAGCWILWGQAADARARAKSAEEAITTLREDTNRKLDEYSRAIDDLTARQKETNDLLAGRIRREREMQNQLEKLRGDLRNAYNESESTRAWADSCVPSAVADRLRLPPDPACQ